MKKALEHKLVNKADLVLSLDTLKKMDLQTSIAVLVILILKKKPLMLARSIM